MQFFTKIFYLSLTSFIFSQTSYAKVSLEDQRQLFSQAEKHLQLNQKDKFDALKVQLQDYPLYPYLEYNELRKNISRQSPQKIKNFLTQYKETPLAKRLLSTWLRSLAKRKKWQQFISFYQESTSVTLQCHYFNALLETGKKSVAWPKISQVWLHKKSQPKACDPVFKEWQNAGHQTNALTWKRIALAIDASQIQLARYLTKNLPKQDQEYVQQWFKVRQHPEELSTTSISKNHPYRQLAFAHGIQRLAKKDLLKAISIWGELKNETIYEPQIISKIERSFSLRFLDKPLAETFDYLIFAEPCNQDTKLQEIRIRAALLNHKWDDVLRWLNDFPDNHKNDDQWIYWKARALQMTGKQEQANKLLDHLSNNRSYYGFLASDMLNKDYNFNHNALDVDEDLFKTVKNLPGMMRTSELLKLDKTLDARREWFFILNILDNQEILAAAKLAHEWNWHDRAILTLAKAKHWNDLTIRFPIKHKKQVRQQANKTDIDEAWIYAMMRQESAFMKDAQSPVGALGLMQLMPRTAKATAKKLNQKRPNKTELFKADRNIQLGTAYLNQVYNELEQNPVLAIAAYNAGPHRVKKWLPEIDMEADIWIEMIPFKETRQYVKSVLAYTIIYENKLGIKKSRMTERMPRVSNYKAPKNILVTLK